MNLRLHVGELQRVAGQLEDSIQELRDYPADDRLALGRALRDLINRLETIRAAIILTSGPQ